MRALVLGGGGFIGSHLVNALLAQYTHVRVMEWQDLEADQARRMIPAPVPAWQP